MYQLDSLIVGAGFAGLHALQTLKKKGYTSILCEAGSGIGGTWFWNQYPGARCDVASFEYSYSFDTELEQEWRWSERYAKQPEILNYLEEMAQKHELYPHIRCNTTVTAAHWNDGTQRWEVATSQENYSVRFLIMATGCLSKPNVINLPGRQIFKGEIFHSSRWPDNFSIDAKKVAVMGTGSSGVQIISNIAPHVDQLHVLQRSPHWIMRAGHRMISDTEDAEKKANYPVLRELLNNSLLGMDVTGGGGSALDASPEERRRRYQTSWDEGGPSFLMCFDDLLFSLEANATACEFLAEKITEVVADPRTSALLTPDISRFPVGARRLVMDDNYYSRFNLPHVHLQDMTSQKIESMTPSGLKFSTGEEIDFDVLILATGFDALTGAMLDIDISGRHGLRLKEKWKTSPDCYMGLFLADFPNLFAITGPGSPSVFSNVVISIEQHIAMIESIIFLMEEKGYSSFNASTEAELEWADSVRNIAGPTVFTAVKSSWYWGSNIPGKTQAFLPYLGGVGTYRQLCSESVTAQWPGLRFQ